MPYELKGNWKKGRAYDLHTLSSVYLGEDEQGHKQFDSQRSEMGELLYQLKYQGKRKAVYKIIDLISRKFKGLDQFDFYIPVPSTNKARAYQPVEELANELGRRENISVIQPLSKKSGSQLKDIQEPEKRLDSLKENIKFVQDNKLDIAGKKVLLIDDLYRSGATLSICTDILYNQGKVGSVSVLTMTKTRSSS